MVYGHICIIDISNVMKVLMKLQVWYLIMKKEIFERKKIQLIVKYISFFLSTNDLRIIKQRVRESLTNTTCPSFLFKI